MVRRGRSDLHGIAIIDKPEGMSSAAVVGKIRARFRLKKVGHAGTLDPLATGVLPICINEATKMSRYFSESGKRYELTLKLGETTTTQDTEGEITETRPVEVDRTRLNEVLATFVGEIDQVPPMFSAKKLDGKTLYKIARKGEVVEREAQRVHVYSLSILDVDLPYLKLEVSVSKGFYVRTLCHDIGEALGCGAHMTQLRRTAHGPFAIKEALDLDALLSEGGDAIERELIAMTDDQLGIPLMVVSDYAASLIANGQPLTAGLMADLPPEILPESRLVRAIKPDGVLCAILKREIDSTDWRDRPPREIIFSIERGFVLG